MFKCGHTGPLFKPIIGRVGKGWVSPAGQHFAFSHELDHADYADVLIAKFYPEMGFDIVARGASCIDLLLRGWVRVYLDGYYEVYKIEGCKKILVDLCCALNPDEKVTIDIIESQIKVIEMTAQNFIDKYQ